MIIITMLLAADIRVLTLSCQHGHQHQDADSTANIFISASLQVQDIIVPDGLCDCRLRRLEHLHSSYLKASISYLSSPSDAASLFNTSTPFGAANAVFGATAKHLFKATGKYTSHTGFYSMCKSDTG